MTEKWKTLGASLLPVFLWIFIQSMVLVSEPSLLDWELGALRLFGMEEEEAWVFLQENQTYVVYVLMNMITLIPASLWFRQLSMWTPRDSRFPVVFRGRKSSLSWHPGRLVFLLALGGFLQFFTDLILTGVAAGFPELMKSLQSGYGKSGDEQSYHFVRPVHLAFGPSYRGTDIQRPYAGNFGEGLSFLAG